MKPASQLLAQAIGTTDASVSNALVKIQEDESQQRGAEAQMRAKKEVAGEQEWGFRPTMSDFCALNEESGSYIVAEMRNFGGRCTDHTKGPPAAHACVTCAHRVIGGGYTSDAKIEDTYAGAALKSASAGTSTSNPDNLLQKHREGAASRKAFEVSGVYAAKGVLSSKPSYVDWCKALSNEGEYVVCLMHNPHAACATWGAAAGGSPAPAAARASAARFAPAPPAAQPSRAVASLPPSAANASRSPGAKAPRGTEAPRGAAGPVPGGVQEFEGFYEWLLGTKLTPEASDVLRQEVARWHRENDAMQLEIYRKSVATFAKLRGDPPELRDKKRELLLEGFVDGLRSGAAAGDRLNQALVAMVDEASPPELTDLEVRDFEEYLEWMLGVKLTPPAKHAVETQLSEWYEERTAEGMNYHTSSVASYRNIRDNRPDLLAVVREQDKENFHSLLQENAAQGNQMCLALLPLFVGANSGPAPGYEARPAHTPPSMYSQQAPPQYSPAQSMYAQSPPPQYPPPPSMYGQPPPQQYPQPPSMYGQPPPQYPPPQGMYQQPPPQYAPAASSYAPPPGMPYPPQGAPPPQPAAPAPETSAQKIQRLKGELEEARKSGDSARIAELQVDLQRATMDNQEELAFKAKMMQMDHETRMNISRG